MQLKDYGQARQITLFEHGKVALQILTSDFDACPAEILAWLKSRWREENFLKYAARTTGSTRSATTSPASRRTPRSWTTRPARSANAAVREAEKALAAAERDLAGLLADPAITPAAKNTRLIPAAQNEDHRRPQEPGRRRRGPRQDPREAARQRHRPRRQGRAAAHRPPRPADGAAAARAQRRALAVEPAQRLPARRRRIPRHHPPDHHPRPRRHHHLRPRAAITVTLDRPGAPRVARALALLIDEINATPPAMPGDTRPITYQLARASPAFNTSRSTASGVSMKRPAPVAARKPVG